MENQENRTEFVYETSHRKGKMETLTMLASRNIKKEESEVDGINNVHRIINEMMNVWMDGHVVEDVVNEKGETINRDQNWVVEERIIGIKTKRV